MAAWEAALLSRDTGRRGRWRGLRRGGIVDDDFWSRAWLPVQQRRRLEVPRGDSSEEESEVSEAESVSVSEAEEAPDRSGGGARRM